MTFSYKRAFLAAFDRLGYDQQELIRKAVEEIESYHKTGRASYGLRIKKLYGKGGRNVLEARASIDLRIVWVEAGSEAVFSLLGDHEEVRRFIRSFR